MELKKQLLEQVRTFGKRPFVGLTPRESMTDTHVTVELVAMAKKVLERKMSIKATGLRELLDMEPTVRNAMLCVIILQGLGWVKWNENCRSCCTWVRGDIEFD